MGESTSESKEVEITKENESDMLKLEDLNELIQIKSKRLKSFVQLSEVKSVFGDTEMASHENIINKMLDEADS